MCVSDLGLFSSFYRHQFVENNLILKMGPVDKRKVCWFLTSPRVYLDPWVLIISRWAPNCSDSVGLVCTHCRFCVPLTLETVAC